MSLLRLVAIAATLLGGLAVPVAQAQEWGSYAFVSSTMGVAGDRICVGETSRGDIGCLTNAPYISASTGYMGIGTSTPSAALDISASYATALAIRNGTNNLLLSMNNITANTPIDIQKTGNSAKFGGNVGVRINGLSPSTTLHVSGTIRIADGGEACDANRSGAIRYTSASVFQFCSGSGWQSVGDLANQGGGAADRITSGTTNVVANSDTGYVSFTSGGVTTGYYSPGGIFGAVGISTTSNQSSFTTAYMSGNVGIGEAPSASAILYISSSGSAPAARLSSGSPGTTGRRVDISPNLNSIDFYGIGGVTSGDYSYINRSTPNMRLLLNPGGTGYIGINTAAQVLPSATLHVSGTGYFTGKVGVGTIDPSTALHVMANANGPLWADATLSPSANTSYEVMRLGKLSDPGSTSPVASIFVSDTGGGSNLRFAATRYNGDFMFSRASVTGTKNIALITGSNSGSNQLVIYASNTNVNSIKLSNEADSFINNTYNFGIGTNSPSATLHLGGTNPFLTVGNQNASLKSELRPNDLNFYRANSPAYISNDSTGGTLTLQASDTAVMSITYSGVGVTGNANAIASITTAFNVAGTIRIADGGETCDASRNGAIRYTSSSVFQFCSGSVWQSVGDLANQGGGAADRITSGTTNVVANSDTGYVSFTSGGVTTGYYSPGGIFGAVGISTTSNQASFTTVYASGKVGIGDAPSASAHLLVSTSLGIPAARFGSGQNLRYIDLNPNSASLDFFTPGGNVSHINRSNPSQNTIFNPDGTGRVGIGTVSLTAPLATLHVSGTGYFTGNAGIGVAPSISTVALNIVGDQVISGSLILRSQTGSYVSTLSYPSNFNTLHIRGAHSNSNNVALALQSSGGVNNLVMTGDGKFGLGQGFNSGSSLPPSVTLHVSGTVRIADGGEACDGNRAGAIRYTSSSVFEFCSGSGWQSVSQLASLGGGSNDRITSGTTNVVANSDTGYVSFTSGGVTTGYYSPGGIFGAVGISTTSNQASFTTVYASGNVAVGAMPTGNAQFYVSGTSGVTARFGSGINGRSIDIAPSSANIEFNTGTHAHINRGVPATHVIINADGTGRVGIGTPSLTTPSATLHVSGTGYYSGSVTIAPAALATPSGSLHIVTNGAGPALAIGRNDTSNTFIVTNSNNQLTFKLNGINTNGLSIDAAGTRVGIGLNINAPTPSTSLHVSGTLRIADGGETCDVNRSGAIRYTAGGEFQICYGSGGWATLANSTTSGTTGVASDRIVSGTSSVIASNDASVTISTAGAQRMIVGSNGYVGIGTNNPLNNMHLYGAGTVGMRIDASSTTAGNGRGVIGFIRDGVYSWDVGTNINLLNTNDFHIREDGSTIRMTIQDATGNVGIGTNAPSHTLHVNGSGPGVVARISYATGTSYMTFDPSGKSFNIYDGVGGFSYINRNMSSSVPSLLLQSDSSGRVGIGTVSQTTPSATLHVSGTMLVGNSDLGSLVGALLVKQKDNTSGGGIVIERSGSTATGRMYLNSSNDLIISRGGGGASDTFVMTSTGTMGIGKSPVTDIKLDVDGAISVSNTVASCAANTSGGIRWNGTEFQVCYGSGGWATLANSSVSGTSGVSSDRIVSGTTSIVANTNGYISLTTGNVNTGYFDTAGRLVVPGISTTTNQASFTAVYASGNVGIGIAPQAAPGGAHLYVTGTAVSNVAARFGNGTNGRIIDINPRTASIDYYGIGGQTGATPETFHFNRATPSMSVVFNPSYSAGGGGSGRVGINTIEGGTPSATLHVSGTGYLTGNTGIGTTPLGAASATLSIRGGIAFSNGSGYFPTLDVHDSAQLAIRGHLNGAGLVFKSASDGSKIAGIYSSSSDTLRISGANSTLMYLNGGRVLITSETGSLNTTPSSTLHVNGSIQFNTTSDACDTNRSGAMRYAGGEFQVCYGSGGWATLANSTTSGTTGVASDRIVSGTSSVIATQNSNILVNNALSITKDSSGSGIASFQVSDSASGEATGMAIYGYNSNHSTAYFQDTISIQTSGNAKDLMLSAPSTTSAIRFHVGGSSNSPSFERMRIAANGNVGIGITAPSATLDVSGSVKLAGTGSEACASATGNHGTLRVDPVSGKLQICRTR